MKLYPYTSRGCSNVFWDYQHINLKTTVVLNKMFTIEADSLKDASYLVESLRVAFFNTNDGQKSRKNMIV